MSPDSQRPIKLILVDRDKLVCHGFRTLIECNSAFKIVGVANNGIEGLNLVEREQPDVILLELEFGAESGLDILQDLLAVSNSSCVLVLTHNRDADLHRKAMTLGAAGVVQKDVELAVLLKAIEKVYAGEIWYDRRKLGGVLRDIVRNSSGKKEDPTAIKIASLTPRELEVIALVSKGLKNRDIGEHLFISETTVRHHLTSVFDKLEIANRLELIIFALSSGLATLPGNLSNHSNGNGNGSGKAVISRFELRQAV